VRQLFLEREDKSVFIRPDGSVTIQEFTTVTDKLKEAGIEKVGIMSQPVR
jgi:biopolymer transport protein ExbD